MIPSPDRNLWIEPASRPVTNGRLAADLGATVVRDDRLFEAVLVGLGAFGVVFAASGMGHASTLRMIPSIFLTQRQRLAPALPGAQAQATAAGQLEAAGVLGLASAIGAYGGFFIPKSLGTAIAMTGSPAAALRVFIVFYMSCLALTWWHYSRRHAPMPC